ncbi:hypothetical protein ACIQU6_42025 [Streptomyces sp. NPDC090442]|uniref:hypothetical protein n=1 Tax=Streptomyces sp. NPDC090442 TaxID=3365962 RepID=UPI0038112EFB
MLQRTTGAAFRSEAEQRALHAWIAPHLKRHQAHHQGLNPPASAWPLPGAGASPLPASELNPAERTAESVADGKTQHTGHLSRNDQLAGDLAVAMGLAWGRAQARAPRDGGWAQAETEADAEARAGNEAEAQFWARTWARTWARDKAAEWDLAGALAEELLEAQIEERAGAASHDTAPAVLTREQAQTQAQALTEAWTENLAEDLYQKWLRTQPGEISQGTAPLTQARTSVETLVKNWATSSYQEPPETQLEEQSDGSRRTRRSAGTGEDPLRILQASLDAASANARAEAGQRYVDETVRKVLKEAVSSVDIGTLSLDEEFTVTFLHAPAQFGTTGHRERKMYTLRELALGVPYRKNMLHLGGQTTVHAITPARSDFPSVVLRALKGGEIRSGVAEEFSRDADLLEKGDALKDAFTGFSRSRLRGRMMRLMTDFTDIEEALFAYAWLNGSLTENLVIFKGKVIPDVVGIVGIHEYSGLLVSVATGETHLWRRDDGSPRFQEFIKKHLSEFDRAAAKVDDFIPDFPWYHRGMDRASEEIKVKVSKPRIKFKRAQDRDTFGELRKASFQRLKSNLNGYVYTKAEQDQDLTGQFGRAAVQGGEILMMLVIAANPGTAGALAAFASGLGFGFGSAYFSEMIAENTDQGDVYRQAMEDAQLDRWLSVGAAALDFNLALRNIGKQVPKSVKSIFDVVGDAQRKVLHGRAAHIASNGAKTKKFTQEISGNGAVCWDAVAKVQKMAGIITPQELQALRAVRSNSFEAYLGGAGKEIVNRESLANLPGGYRIAFVVEEGNQRQMIHAMLSTGDSKMAGLNNAGLHKKLSPGFAEVDFKNEVNRNLLTFSDDGTTRLLERGKVRVYAESGTPEFRIETTRPEITSTALSSGESATRDGLLSSARQRSTGEGKTIGKLIENPAGQCEKLMTPVASFMRDNGFTDIKYRGMGIWDNVSDRTYMNHYAVVGERAGKRWVFDLSAGQFGNKGMQGLDGPIIDLEENWAKRYADSTTRKLIKYQDFDTAGRATSTFGSVTGLDPLDYIPDSTLLNSPTWYQLSKSPMPFDSRALTR